MYIFGKSNNHLIKNNYKATFSLPQKVKLINKPILKCACGPDFVICLTQDFKTYCYFQSAIHNIDFNQDLKIVDVETQQNLILFVTQQGELYATQFLAQKVLNDCLKPKLVKILLSFSSSKDKAIKQVKMVGGNIFLKVKNNQIVHFKKNDWMETKAFSDPKLVLASKTCDIIDIKSVKGTYYFLTSEGSLYSTLQSQLSKFFKKIELKQKLKKINSNKNELFGINETGQIVKIQVSNNKGKTQKLWKISNKFSDLIIGDENYYAITQNQQAWVWGKNSHGELGLSDYEPRNSLYPLVSLENYYIQNIFIGQNYVCCTVDGFKTRDTFKQKESVRSSFREMRSYSTQNNFPQCKDSLNQTEQFLMPIRYTEQESQTSMTDQNQSCSDINKTGSKKIKFQKDNDVGQRKSNIKIVNKSIERESFKSSLKSQNPINKLSSKKIQENSCRKSINKSIRSNSKSFISQSKSRVSNSKLTPKSVVRDRSFFKTQKGKSEIKSHLKDLQNEKSQRKHKRQSIVSYKGQKIEQAQRQNERDFHHQCQQNLEKQLNEKDRKQKENLKELSETFKLQKQGLKDVIASLEDQLKNKKEENKDLYELLSEKNATISDITQKIQLLQSAIEQHEKALTSRDNKAQQFYLREKEYQLHIQKLQSQVQKMMQVLNYNERNKETELYKKQMQRLSFEVKSRIQDEKQYYKERIGCLEKKFEEQRNIYELEIRKLQQQILSLKSQNVTLMRKIDYKPIGNKFSIQTAGLQNNSSNCIESPTFHTLQMKHNLKRQLQGNYLLNESQITLQDQVNENQRIPLQESNRQLPNFNSLQKKNQQQGIIKQNFRSNNFFNKEAFENDQNIMESRSQSQVKEILNKIQVTKSYISKSAHKLINILDNEKI